LTKTILWFLSIESLQKRKIPSSIGFLQGRNTALFSLCQCALLPTSKLNLKIQN